MSYVLRVKVVFKILETKEETELVNQIIFKDDDLEKVLIKYMDDVYQEYWDIYEDEDEWWEYLDKLSKRLDLYKCIDLNRECSSDLGDWVNGGLILGTALSMSLQTQYWLEKEE